MNKKLSIFALLVLLFSLISSTVFAQAAGLGLGIGVLVLIIIIFVLALIFWLWMLIDCIRREFDQKVLWIVLILLTGIIGAILYYFLVKRKSS